MYVTVATFIFARQKLTKAKQKADTTAKHGNSAEDKARQARPLVATELSQVLTQFETDAGTVQAQKRFDHLKGPPVFSSELEKHTIATLKQAMVAFYLDVDPSKVQFITLYFSCDNLRQIFFSLLISGLHRKCK